MAGDDVLSPSKFCSLLHFSLDKPNSLAILVIDTERFARGVKEGGLAEGDG